MGYVYDGTSIQEQVINRMTAEYDATTGDKKQSPAEKKYLYDKVTKGDDVIKEIKAQELAKKYGLKIESKSYKQALQDGFQGTTGQ